MTATILAVALTLVGFAPAQVGSADRAARALVCRLLGRAAPAVRTGAGGIAAPACHTAGPPLPGGARSTLKLTPPRVAGRAAAPGPAAHVQPPGPARPEARRQGQGPRPPGRTGGESARPGRGRRMLDVARRHKRILAAAALGGAALAHARALPGAIDWLVGRATRAIRPWLGVARRALAAWPTAVAAGWLLRWAASAIWARRDRNAVGGGVRRAEVAGR